MSFLDSDLLPNLIKIIYYGQIISLIIQNVLLYGQYNSYQKVIYEPKFHIFKSTDLHDDPAWKTLTKFCFLLLQSEAERFWAYAIISAIIKPL